MEVNPQSPTPNSQSDSPHSALRTPRLNNPQSAIRNPQFPSLPPWLLLAGFCLTAAGACFDYQFLFPWIEIQQWHYWFGCGFVALLVWTDGEPGMGRRALLAAAVFILTLLAASRMRELVRNLPLRKGVSSGDALRALFGTAGPYLWAAALWLASPLLLGGAGGRRVSLTVRVAVWGLTLYGACCLASVITSQDPPRSADLFAHERALPLALVFAWLRLAPGAPALRSGVGRCVAAVLGTLILLGALVGLADIFYPAWLRAGLVEHKLIFVEAAAQSAQSTPERRLVFPMLHFNRTAYLALLAIMTLLLASLERGLRPRRRWAVRAGLLPAFFVMVVSYTRGVTAAAVAGLCAWAALVSRRALVVILGACLIVGVALPARQREHFLSIFRASTYRLDQGEMTSMKLRQWGWQYGLEVVRKLPLTGLGYGTRVVRDDYIRYIKATHNRRLIDDVEENATHQHMHNLWLEVAVESGLPALAAFLVFCLARWALLARAFWRAPGPARPRVAAWIAFELSLMIAGMIFYMLKQNFGMMHFFVWGFMISELDDAEEEIADCGLKFRPDRQS